MTWVTMVTRMCDNYRPISVLPVLSKVFEKCIYNQLISYFSSEISSLLLNMGLSQAVPLWTVLLISLKKSLPL